jgi:hypothetical protein
VLASLQQLSLAQPGNRAVCLPSSQHTEVFVGGLRAGLPRPQDFGSKRAATTFPCGCHPGASSSLSHQGLAGIPGDGQLLQEIPALHCLHTTTAHRLAARRKEGVGETGVVCGDGCSFRSSQASSAACHLPAHPTVHRGSVVSGRGGFSNTCGCVPPIAATWQEGLVALSFFSKKLEEANRSTLLVTGTFSLLLGHQTLSG